MKMIPESWSNPWIPGGPMDPVVIMVYVLVLSVIIGLYLWVREKIKKYLEEG